MGLATLCANSQTVYAQSSTADEKKFEVGAQFSILHSALSHGTFTGIVCVTTPCPSFVISHSREFQPGFGGRFGYNLTSNLAVEAEVNFFPDADSYKVPAGFQGGNKIEGLFGVKAAKRFEKVGVFGKARPGFLHASKGDLRPRTGSLCVAIFPPPAGCFETSSKTNFALDLGGVVEVYPTKRTIIRFDAGDTMVFLGERNIPGFINPLAGSLAPSFLTIIPASAETTHNFQLNVGVGFRF